MATDIKYKVYLSQPVKNEFALVIVTYGLGRISYVSEYFALIHAKESRMYSMKYELEDANFLEKEFGYTLEVFCEETLEAAQAELDGYILSKYEESKDPYYINHNFLLREIPERKLMSLAVQGFYEEQFAFIQEKSICNELRLYLRKTNSFPKLKKSSH